MFTESTDADDEATNSSHHDKENELKANKKDCMLTNLGKPGTYNSALAIG
jgi:hypothetical protein